MKVPVNNIGGEVVKDNETYLLRDNKLLKNLVVSSTLLLPTTSGDRRLVTVKSKDNDECTGLPCPAATL